MGGRGRQRTRFGFPGGQDRPCRTLKKFRNDDHDGKGISRWCSVNDDRAEEDANDDDVGERGATAADDGYDGGNCEEDRVDDNDGGGNDWGDVDVDNNGGGVAYLFLCLPPIIIESNRDRNGGGRRQRRSMSRSPPCH